MCRNFAKFTKRHLCQSVFVNKVAGPRATTLLKKRLLHRCFPLNFVKFLRTLSLWNTSGGCFCVLTYFVLLLFNSMLISFPQTVLKVCWNREYISLYYLQWVSTKLGLNSGYYGQYCLFYNIEKVLMFSIVCE